jgi:hypothetical protein
MVLAGVFDPVIAAIVVGELISITWGKRSHDLTYVPGCF